MEISVKTRNRIFYVLLFNSIVAAFSQTVLNTALVPIMRDMGISAATAGWLISSFSLVMGIMVLATAFLIRRFSCRSLFLTSVCFFCIGLLLAAISPNFAVLLIGRLFQAISSGILVSLTQVVILTTFPPAERGSKMGIFGLVASAAPVLSPLIAGVVIDNFGWRMIFWGAFAVSLIVLLVGFIVVKNITETQVIKFDMPSFALCSVGFIGIIIGLGNLGGSVISVANVATPVSVGLVALAMFVIRQQKLSEPFLQLKVFNNRELRLAIITIMIMFCGTIATATILPLYIQSVRQFNATTAGLILMPGSLLTAVVSPIAGKIYDKVGIRKLYLCGASLMLAGHIALSFLTLTTPVPMLILFFSLFQISVGFMFMPTITWGMSTLDSKYTSDGTAIINSLRTVGGAIGAALFVSIMTIASHGSEPSQMIYGVNIAFIGIAVFSLTLLVIAVLFVGKTKRPKEAA